MKILSIESSCDDSALAYTDIKSAKLLWHTKISQEENHKIYGGVVPELASRLFAKDLPILLQKFQDKFDFNDIACVSVTCEPGLSTSLLEGVMMAKALALSLRVPLLGINHLKGHIYSLFINQKEEIFPISVLLVSGGHTMILECYGYDDMKIISQTLDDSFGECYDKVAKMLALGYPGGVLIDTLAREAMQEFFPHGNCLQKSSNIANKTIQSPNESYKINQSFIQIYTHCSLPIPLVNQNTLNFSFSGLKNAFRLKLHSNLEVMNIVESAISMQQKLKELYAYCSDITQQETIQTKQSLENEICEKEAILHDILTQIQSHPYVRALALSFQESATTHLVQKCKKYLQNTNHIKHFAIVGGASANSLLREKLRNLCQKFDKTLLMSDIAFCADNAAMIGRATLAKIHSNPDIIKQRDSVMQNITSKGYLQIKDTDLLDQHIKNIKQIAQDKQNYIYSPQKSLLENVQNLCKQKQLDDTKANGEVSKKSCITPDESEKYKEKTYSEQEKDMKDRDSPFFDYLLQQLLELDISPRNTEI